MSAPSPDYYNIGREIFLHHDLARFDQIADILRGRWNTLPENGSRIYFFMAAARVGREEDARELARILPVNQIDHGLREAFNQGGSSLEPETPVAILRAAHSTHPGALGSMLAMSASLSHLQAVNAICDFAEAEFIPLDFRPLRQKNYNISGAVNMGYEYENTARTMHEVTNRIIRTACLQEIGRANIEATGDVAALNLALVLARTNGIVTEENCTTIINMLQNTSRADLNNAHFVSAYDRSIPLGEAIISATLAGIDSAPSEGGRQRIREILFSMPSGGLGPDSPSAPGSGPINPRGPRTPSRQ